jgi:copper chaperone CopZ
MIKTKANVGGMMCGMCETHVQEAIRKTLPESSKVKADRKKGTVEFITPTAVDEETVKKAIEATGYEYGGMESAEAGDDSGLKKLLHGLL